MSTARRQVKLTPEQLAKRDAKIVKAWNDGVTLIGLRERFGISEPPIKAALKAAKSRGEPVREAGRKRQTWWEKPQ